MSEVENQDALPEIDQEEMMNQMEDSFQRANKALESLENAFMVQDTKDAKKAPEMASHIEAALEQFGLGLEAEQGSFKGAINKVIALIMRMFEAVIDYIRRSQHKAKEYIVACDAIINTVKTIPPNSTTSKAVDNAATMAALSFDGNSPQYMTRDLDGFFADVIRSRQHVPTKEINAILAAIKAGKDITAEVANFHARLELGLMDLGDKTTTDSKLVYNTCDPKLPVYSSKRVVGDRFIFGQISAVTENGKFEYSCTVRRDNQTKLRVKNFPAMRQNDISLVARTIRRFCEDLLRNTSIENDLFKALRDVQALQRSDPTRKDITALRTISDAAQSTYLVRVRHALIVAEFTLFYLRDSIKCYNQVKEVTQHE